MKQIIGVDVGGTLLRAARFDPELNLLERAEQETRIELGSDAVFDRLIETIRQVFPESPGDLMGIGLVLPGPIDPHEGILIAPPNLPWKDMPIVRMVKEALGGGPVLIGNDADMAGLAEHQLGAGRGSRHMIYMTISTGVGSGIIIDGRPYVGRGQAGEAGHMVVEPGGPICGCGKRGHLEALSSGTAIARIARERLAAGEASSVRDRVGGDLAAVTSRIVGEAAQAGDPLARGIIAQAGRYLGIAVASLMMLFNPERFVFGGGVSQLGDLLFDPLREAMKEYVIHPVYWEHTEIVFAQLKTDVGLYGGAALVRVMQQ
jgi:glucokinase